MSTLVKIELPKLAGIKRVLDQLEVGGSLSKVCLDEVKKNETLRVSAYLPKRTSSERSIQFDIGGLMYGENQSSSAASEVFLKIEMLDFLKSSTDNYILLENPLSKPSDEWLEKRENPIWTNMDSVFHYIDTGDLFRMDSFLRESASVLPSSMFFLSENPHFEDGSVVSAKDLKNIAKSLKATIVRGLYDGESFLVSYLN